MIVNLYMVDLLGVGLLIPDKQGYLFRNILRGIICADQWSILAIS